MTRNAVRSLLVCAGLIALIPDVTAGSRGAEQAQPAPIDATLFRDIARRQNPAVVSIVARSRGRAWDVEEQEIFRLFGVSPPEAGSRVQRVLGSGFVIGTAGEILTNNHLVEGAETIEVTLFGDDRRQYHAVTVGRDPLTDTALIRLEDPPSTLQPATLGDSGTLEPGDWVMAIGNPFTLGHTVTVGFVSFQGRPFKMLDGQWQDLIQTDASINPGNSGGPLINVRGEVVGINTAFLDSDTGGNVGIGFAVPINTVKDLLPQLRLGKVVRGQLGAQFHDGPILEDEARELGLRRVAGALVMVVDGDSGAGRGGLRAGDVVMALNGRPVVDARQLMASIATTAPGTTVMLTVSRAGAEHMRGVTVDELPLEDPDVPLAEPDALGGLTLNDLTPAVVSRLAVPADVDGAVVVNVQLDSPADEAGLIIGDIIRAVNRRTVRSAVEATPELRGIAPHAPIFLLVWRRGVEVLLLMRKD